MELEGYTADKLSDAKTNIAIGCWYLNYLGGLFDGDMRKVLAGYNAGPNNVQNWLNSEGKLDNIPYEETEQYLERVLRYYEIYRGLYSDF
jgi:soluble lytic murein transglycosylase